MDEFIGKPILGFLPDPPTDLNTETGDVVFYRNLDPEPLKSPFWLFMQINDWFEARTNFPRFSKQSVFVVYPLDPERWEDREILGPRIQFEHTFSQYPAFFQAGKTTRIDIFDGKTLSSPIYYRNLDVKALESSIINVSADPARFGGGELSLDSLGAIPSAELVVIEYLDGKRFLVERRDLLNRLSLNTPRLPGIQQTLLNLSRVTHEEKILRSNLIRQLERTSGVAFAFISAIRARREVEALNARNESNSPSPSQGNSPRPGTRRERTSSMGSNPSLHRRARSSGPGSQPSSQDRRFLEFED